MRDPETIETELMEIAAIPDDIVKFERIVAWCATHPDEVPFALHQFMGRRGKQARWSGYERERWSGRRSTVELTGSNTPSGSCRF